jgi:hypothetical protein
MAARPWTDADDARLHELHAQGATLTAIAKALDRSKDTISKKAAAAGLGFDRSRTDAATKALVVDAKSRRAALQLRHLTRAEHLFDRLEAATFHTLTRGGGGSEETSELRYVPPRDERDLALTIKAHEEASLRLDLHDANANATVVIGLLQQTAAALGITDHDDTAP